MNHAWLNSSHLGKSARHLDVGLWTKLSIGTLRQVWFMLNRYKILGSLWADYIVCSVKV